MHDMAFIYAPSWYNLTSIALHIGGVAYSRAIVINFLNLASTFVQPIRYSFILESSMSSTFPQPAIIERWYWSFQKNWEQCKEFSIWWGIKRILFIEESSSVYPWGTTWMDMQYPVVISFSAVQEILGASIVVETGWYTAKSFGHCYAKVSWGDSVMPSCWGCLPKYLNFEGPYCIDFQGGCTGWYWRIGFHISIFKSTQLLFARAFQFTLIVHKYVISYFTPSRVCCCNWDWMSTEKLRSTVV